MLVVDVNALHPVDALHLFDQVVLHSLRALDLENIARVNRTLGQHVAGLHDAARLHAQSRTIGDQVADLVAGVFIIHHDVAVFFNLLKPDLARNFTDDRERFGLPGLKQLLDARQTLRDVLRRRDTAGVEGTHG